ncbi:MAG: hypothetical protein ACI9OJ_005047, partial [Myxococcota bacterium]
ANSTICWTDSRAPKNFFHKVSLLMRPHYLTVSFRSTAHGLVLRKMRQ